MVKPQNILFGTVCGLCLLTGSIADAQISDTSDDILFQSISADACDDRQPTDDKNTAENRAIDSACLIAIKTSGMLQQRYPKLGAESLDLISYRLIDEYLIDLNHQVTLNNDKRVCVKINATLEITPNDLQQLVKEYKNIAHVSDQEIAEAAEKAKNSFIVTPHDPTEKQLVYITPMSFFDSTETNHYAAYLKELFDHNTYFFVTDNLQLADYIITPRLTRAEVDTIDEKNNKMQMTVELDTAAPNKAEFIPLSEQQNHFILFASDKDEQKIADNLIKKLLNRAAATTASKLEKTIQAQLETAQKAKIQLQ